MTEIESKLGSCKLKTNYMGHRGCLNTEHCLSQMDLSVLHRGHSMAWPALPP